MKRTPRYVTANDTDTTADDPNHLIWMSLCGFWTDDMNAIETISLPMAIMSIGEDGVPVLRVMSIGRCPTCGSVMSAFPLSEWESNMRECNGALYHHKRQFMEWAKERCMEGREPSEVHLEYLRTKLR